MAVGLGDLSDTSNFVIGEAADIAISVIVVDADMVAVVVKVVPIVRLMVILGECSIASYDSVVWTLVCVE